MAEEELPRVSAPLISAQHIETIADDTPQVFSASVADFRYFTALLRGVNFANVTRYPRPLSHAEGS